MKLSKPTIIGFAFTAFVFLFVVAHAAPLTYNTDVTVSLTSPAVDFTIKSGSVADSVAVNATSVVATLSSSTGGSFILTSASRDLSISTSSAGGTVGRSCVSSVASSTISQQTGSSNYIITPTDSACVITISNATSSVSSNSATITWTTNYPADSTVSYGTTSSYGSTSSDSSQVLSHSINLSNLSYSTTYHFQASSAAGTTNATSSDQSFITQALITIGVPAGPAPISSSTQTSSTSNIESSIVAGSTSTITLSLQEQLETLLAKLQALQTWAGEQEKPSQKFERDLEAGSEGDDVSRLQLFLIGKNSGPSSKKLAGVGTTGYFGNLTQKALQEFQKSAGIQPASGYFGPKTREYVNSYNYGTTETPSIGATVPAPTTQPTQLTPTTSVPQSPSDINSSVSIQKFERDLEAGSEGDDVSRLQLFLIGKNSGPSSKKLAGVGTTGYFGNLTQKALQEFQKSAGIQPASGYFGPKTRAYVDSLER